MKMNYKCFENVDMEEIEGVLMSNKKYAHLVRDTFRIQHLKEKNLFIKAHARKKANQEQGQDL